MEDTPSENISEVSDENGINSINPSFLEAGSKGLLEGRPSSAIGSFIFRMEEDIQRRKEKEERQKSMKDPVKVTSGEVYNRLVADAQSRFEKQKRIQEFQRQKIEEEVAKFRSPKKSVSKGVFNRLIADAKVREQQTQTSPTKPEPQDMKKTSAEEQMNLVLKLWDYNKQIEEKQMIKKIEQEELEAKQTTDRLIQYKKNLKKSMMYYNKHFKKPRNLSVKDGDSLYPSDLCNDNSQLQELDDWLMQQKVRTVLNGNTNLRREPISIRSKHIREQYVHIATKSLHSSSIPKDFS